MHRKQGYRRLILPLIIALPSLALAKNELTFAHFRDTRDLNPHTYSGEMWAQNMLYESLVKYDHDGGIQPWLATNWQVSDDGKIYTFQLRRDVTFSDGEPFTAQAAKRNFDAIMANKARHGWLELMRVIDRITVVDDHTLQFQLISAYAPFLIELAVTRPMRFISPKMMIDGETKQGVRDYIGTGPYILAEHKINQYAIFKANPTYWGSKPPIDKITMKVIPDHQTRLMAFQRGELDLIYGKNMIDPDAFVHMTQTGKYQTSLSAPISTRMVLLNTTKPILNDLRVRQALAYAVDKQAISAGIFNGSEAPADTLLASNIPYANLGLTPYHYDPQRARLLLSQAGWSAKTSTVYRQNAEQPLTLHLYYESHAASQKTLAEYLQDALRDVGVELILHGEEPQAYRDRQKNGNFDLIFNHSWGMPYDPHSFLASMKQPVHGDYIAQQGLAEKAQIDASIAKALITTNEEERAALYRYVLTTLHHQAVYLPLTYERNRAVYSKNLHGVTFSASQFEIPFDKMYFQ